jgi:hypothetical protein
MKYSSPIFLVLIACNSCSHNPFLPTISSGSQAHDIPVVSIREETRQKNNLERNKLQKKLKAVKVSDGISKSEAEIIGRSYFLQNVGCGSFWEIWDGGEYWIAHGMIGLAAKGTNDVHINKIDGKVTAPTSIGASYSDPLQIIP